MYQGKKIAAILLAGGSGSRFGAKGNKVYVPVGGRPIFQYSLDIFDRHPAVDELVLVVRAGEEEQMEQLPCSTPRRIVTGGASRQESVLHGLLTAEADWVLIHDGARPLVRAEDVDVCLAALETCPGVSAAVRSKDTIKLTDEAGRVLSTMNRANTWLVQTPQGFHRDILLAAHRAHAGEPDITDDCMLLERSGQPVQLVESDYANIKVTTAGDLALAERYLRESGRI